ncbi:MAG: mucoidy inhibitor MuiA family protein [Coriobacteriales bacterium]|nr:mucoidy inhibitor MuiA family protein [Coriobacteriales bacterium]
MDERALRRAEVTIQNVRVYPRGCVLVARGRVDLEAGDNSFVVDCLAAGTNEDSIRVRVPAGVALESVSVTHEELPRERELSEQLADKSRELAALGARMENRRAQKNLWKDNAQAKEGVSLAELEGYLAKLAERLDALDEELARLGERREGIEREQGELRWALEEARARSSAGLLQLGVRVAAAQSMAFEVELRSANASWRPVYDVFVDDVCATSLRLRLRAELMQSTGLAWEGVSLVLSTARTQAGIGVVPRLDSLHLRKRPSAPRGGIFGMGSMAGMGAMMRASAEDTMMLEDEADAEPVPLLDAAPLANTYEHSNSVEYVVSGSWDIATDVSSGTLVEIEAHELAAKLRCQAVPKLDGSVCLVAELAEPLGAEVQGNEASVYLEGDYCGKIMLERPDEGGRTTISLGRDALVRSTRRLLKSFESSTMLRGRRSEASEYELTVTNGRASSVQVLLLDQIPVSDLKDIVVEAGELSGGTLNAETGIVRWELELAPQETRTLRLGYTVSRPKDLEIEQTIVAVADSAGGSVFCPACGSRVMGNQRFCPECGRVL